MVLCESHIEDIIMIIDKGIELPSNPKGKGVLYRFYEMEVGDSAFFAGSNSKGKEHTSARMFGKRSGKKFAARNVEGGVRIWRTE